MSDSTKGTLVFVGFLLFLPAMYLAPTILNAITDLMIKF